MEGIAAATVIKAMRTTAKRDAMDSHHGLHPGSQTAKGMAAHGQKDIIMVVPVLETLSTGLVDKDVKTSQAAHSTKIQESVMEIPDHRMRGKRTVAMKTSAMTTITSM